MDKIVVLVIDDEQTYINSISNILMQKDYKIIQALNGKMGVMVAQKFIPDIIITDWEMPEMNGIEATKLLKQGESTCEIPIIIATGVMIKPQNLSIAMSAGAIDFLRKPINETELLARTESALRLAKAYQKIKEQNSELIKQLTTKILQIQQFNKLKLSAKLHLNKLNQLIELQNYSEIKKLIGETDKLLKSKIYEIDWNEFESHFEIVNKGYLLKLKALYNDLTDYDLRLCAFLKLKMTSKVIARIIYTSPDSVDTARKRLKKKLNLTPEQNLQTFLLNF
jgi:DNA-binding response OmpR family regulator